MSASKRPLQRRCSRTWSNSSTVKTWPPVRLVKKKKNIQIFACCFGNASVLWCWVFQYGCLPLGQCETLFFFLFWSTREAKEGVRCDADKTSARLRQTFNHAGQSWRPDGPPPGCTSIWLATWVHSSPFGWAPVTIQLHTNRAYE